MKEIKNLRELTLKTLTQKRTKIIKIVLKSFMIPVWVCLLFLLT